MRFYILETSVDKVPLETEFSYLDPHNQADAPCCPACGEYVSSLISLPPYNIEIELWDKGFGDIVQGPGKHLLVSGRFKCLWEEHGLSGLDGFAPVSVKRVIRHKRFRGEPPEYYLTSVVRSEALIDQNASGFDWMEGVEPTCDYCRTGLVKRWQKHVLVPGTWQGENIFRPRGMYGSIMTDQKFADFVEQFGITNCYLIPAEKYAHDFYPWEKQRSAD